MAPIIAIGGYKTDWSEEDCFDTPFEIDQRIVKLTGKEKPRVLFIPTASSDGQGYTKSFIQVYGEKLGCPVDVLRLIGEKLTRAEIAAKIRAADLIYVGGGNTLMMMNKWRRLGVDKLLIEAHARGTVLAGVSAGAICWYEWGVSDSRQFYDKTSHEYIRVRGLGLLKGLCCPHFGSSLYDKGHRMAGLRKILKRYPKLKWVGIKDGEGVDDHL
jgi:dipeptidase E